MSTKQINENPEHIWLESLNKIHSDTAIPGFWSTLGVSAQRWAAAISVDAFWEKAKTELPSWREEYRKTQKGKLGVDDLPSFSHKSPERIKEKLFKQYQKSDDPRLHLIESFNFSSAEPSIFCSLKDIVRCRISCSYIDGVEFLAKKLRELAEKENCFVEMQREGRLQGYFAQHLCIKQSVKLKRGGFEKIVEVICEIQIASQMATQMWLKTHNIYETSRVKNQDHPDWQWNPDDPQFIANQLGHMIHLADGLLVQLKNRLEK